MRACVLAMSGLFMNCYGVDLPSHSANCSLSTGITGDRKLLHYYVIILSSSAHCHFLFVKYVFLIYKVALVAQLFFIISRRSGISSRDEPHDASLP